jgi:EAL domain-containing protein (putative c-di-GMP-specific phosphodiesterase class I)
MMEGLIPYIQGLCEEYPIPSGLVQIEITETISSMDHMLVNKIANSLRHMGFSMSMDDFGAQYSNIAVLTQFDFDAVKIDRSLLANVEANNKCGMVLKHTISMLKALGMETVMEGVETREQVEVLRELGCDTIQGFYYGKPEPHEKFYELYMSDK